MLPSWAGFQGAKIQLFSQSAHFFLACVGGHIQRWSAVVPRFLVKSVFFNAKSGTYFLMIRKYNILLLFAAFSAFCNVLRLKIHHRIVYTMQYCIISTHYTHI